MLFIQTMMCINNMNGVCNSFNMASQVTTFFLCLYIILMPLYTLSVLSLHCLWLYRKLFNCWNLQSTMTRPSFSTSVSSFLPQRDRQIDRTMVIHIIKLILTYIFFPLLSSILTVNILGVHFVMEIWIYQCHYCWDYKHLLYTEA